MWSAAVSTSQSNEGILSDIVEAKTSRARSTNHPAAAQQPRLADVAKFAQVSTATVSRVMNNPEVVSAEIKARVHNAIRELRWVPNASAKALATSRTHTVGAIMPTLDHQNFARIVESLQRTMATAKYELLVGVTYYEREVATQQARAMMDRGVEALVLVGADHPEELLSLLDEKRVPYVLLYVAPGSAPGRNVIGYNNYQSFVTITQHLLELGHKSFGLIAQDTSFNDRARARQEGVRNTLAEHGIAIRPRHFVESPWKFEDGMRAFESIMTTDDPPTAIICGNDYLAIGSMLKAQEMGIDIPGDVSITGFDDIDLARLLQPGITTMKVPDALVGEMAGRFFIEVLQGKEGRLGDVPDPELILRGSTARPKET
jgi:LacI family transcriptional regulator